MLATTVENMVNTMHTRYKYGYKYSSHSVTTVLWSGSLADKTIRVWRHKVTADEPNLAELRAANSVYLAQYDEARRERDEARRAEQAALRERAEPLASKEVPARARAASPKY
eukprot:53252-Pyramimonas_sp.AAC.2